MRCGESLLLSPFSNLAQTLTKSICKISCIGIPIWTHNHALAVLLVISPFTCISLSSIHIFLGSEPRYLIVIKIAFIDVPVGKFSLSRAFSFMIYEITTVAKIIGDEGTNAMMVGVLPVAYVGSDYLYGIGSV